MNTVRMRWNRKQSTKVYEHRKKLAIAKAVHVSIFIVQGVSECAARAYTNTSKSTPLTVRFSFRNTNRQTDTHTGMAWNERYKEENNRRRKKTFTVLKSLRCRLKEMKEPVIL